MNVRSFPISLFSIPRKEDDATNHYDPGRVARSVNSRADERGRGPPQSAEMLRALLPRVVLPVSAVRSLSRTRAERRVVLPVEGALLGKHDVLGLSV